MIEKYGEVTIKLNVNEDELTKLRNEANNTEGTMGTLIQKAFSEVARRVNEKTNKEKERTYKVDELVEDIEYECSNESIYKMSNGKLMILVVGDRWVESAAAYNIVKCYTFKECEFHPKKGERYYYPSLEVIGNYATREWNDSQVDRNIKKYLGIKRTANQARKRAKEIGWS